MFGCASSLLLGGRLRGRMADASFGSMLGFQRYKCAINWTHVLPCGGLTAGDEFEATTVLHA
jgi:hypothetical protein